VRDGKVAKALFTCKNGVWTDANVLCPDRFAYFCRVGPHAVPIGEELVLGSGPAVLECKFPGVFALNQPSSSAAGSVQPSSSAAGSAVQLTGKSQLVRDVQKFLSTQKAGIDCSNSECDGQFSEKTLTAVAIFVNRNFAKMTADERKRWGITGLDTTNSAVMSKNPIDLIPLFVRTFDVPKAD